MIVLLSIIIQASPPQLDKRFECCRKSSNQSILFRIVGNGYIQNRSTPEGVLVIENDKIFDEPKICCNYVINKEGCLQCFADYEAEKKVGHKYWYFIIGGVLLIIIWILIKKKRKLST